MMNAALRRSNKERMTGCCFVMLSHFVSNSRALSAISSRRTVATDAVKSLLQDTTLLDWGEPSSSSSFTVHDPASPDTVLAHVPIMDQNDAHQAIRRSHEVLTKWKDDTTASFRSSLLQKWS